MRRRISRRCLGLSACCLLATACGDDPGSPEAEIRGWVNRGEAAAEDKDRSTLLDMISVHYADGRGNDRDRIGDLLRLYFFRQQSIALLVDIDNIAVTGDTAALVDLTVGMAGTAGSAIGIRADAYQFEMELQKPDDEWMLIGARWAELGSQLH